MPVTFLAAIAAVPNNAMTLTASAINFVFTLLLPVIAAVHSAHEDGNPSSRREGQADLTFKLTSRRPIAIWPDC